MHGIYNDRGAMSQILVIAALYGFHSDTDVPLPFTPVQPYAWSAVDLRNNMLYYGGKEQRQQSARSQRPSSTFVSRIYSQRKEQNPGFHSLPDDTLNRGPITIFQDKLTKGSYCDETGYYPAVLVS